MNTEEIIQQSESAISTDPATSTTDQLKELSRLASEKARETAMQTDQCIHDHPWKAVAMTGAFGFVIGLLLRERDYESWE
jgi:ElaB/YqjD/DUF883 family membrane-anchored ribosome-binding protein